MKKQDKFEEYLRKEMDSIQYDGEDRMWNGFKGQLPTVTPIQQILSWSLPIVAIGLVGIGIYLSLESQSIGQSSIGLNESSGIEIKDRSETIKNEITKTIISEKKIETELDYEPDSVTKDIIQIRNEVVGNKVQDRFDDDSEVLLDANNRIAVQKIIDSEGITSQVVTTSQVKIEDEPTNADRQSIIQSKERDPWSNQFTTNQSENGVTQVGKTLMNSERKEDLKSKQGKLKLDIIDYIDLRTSFLMLEQQQDLPEFKSTELLKKRLSNWAGFVGVGAGANNYQLYSVGANYNRVLSQRFDLNLSFGLQTELGNIVSQDSIIKEIGPAIIETRKDKDLNDLTSVYLSAVPLAMFGQFGIGIGPKLSYAVYNRFQVEEIYSSANSPDFNVILPVSAGKIYSETQDWSSLNRLRIGGNLILHYQSQSRFGIQFHLSKNFNKLIKDDLAVTDRSNSPIVLGLQLNYLIKN